MLSQLLHQTMKENICINIQVAQTFRWLFGEIPFHWYFDCLCQKDTGVPLNMLDRWYVARSSPLFFMYTYTTARMCILIIEQLDQLVYISVCDRCKGICHVTCFSVSIESLVRFNFLSFSQLQNCYFVNFTVLQFFFRFTIKHQNVRSL